MTVRFISLLYLICFCVSVGAQEIRSLDDLQLNGQKLGVQGNVKSITCFNYSPIEWFNPALSESWEDYQFDESGNVLEEVTWLGYKQATFSSKKVYTYNSENNMLTTTCYGEDDGRISFQHKYLYPEKGRVTFIEYGPDGKEHTTRYNEFDEKGNQVKWTIPGKYKDSLVLKYDAENRIIQRELYRDKRLNSTTTWYYSPESIVVTDKWSDGIIYSICSSTFNAAGILVKYVYDSPNSDPQYGLELIYEYDQYKNIISYTRNEGGAKLKNDRKSYTCKYDYDAQGNWTKRFMYQSDGSLNSTIERKIVYY